MNITEFIQNFADQFEETDGINAETKFHDLEEWGSLLGLSIIAMVDDEYDVVIKGDELRACITVQDVYDLVNSKLK